MKSKDVLKLLKKDNWQVERIKGSHYVMRKEGQTIVLPLHNREMPKGLAEQILKDAGLRRSR